MRICPNCNESYTYFNSYFGIDICTSCGWSEDIDSNQEVSKLELSENFFKGRENMDLLLKEQKTENKKEELNKSSNF